MQALCWLRKGGSEFIVHGEWWRSLKLSGRHLLRPRDGAQSQLQCQKRHALAWRLRKTRPAPELKNGSGLDGDEDTHQPVSGAEGGGETTVNSCPVAGSDQRLTGIRLGHQTGADAKNVGRYLTLSESSCRKLSHPLRKFEYALNRAPLCFCRVGRFSHIYGLPSRVGGHFQVH